VRGLERALELDPRILRTLQQIALPYQSLRAMPRSAAMWDHALAIKPNDADTKVARAFLELDWKADTRPLIPQLWPIETATLLGPAPSRSASKKIVASLSPKETASK
jgi:hypothetical protein